MSILVCDGHVQACRGFVPQDGTVSGMGAILTTPVDIFTQFYSFSILALRNPGFTGSVLPGEAVITLKTLFL